jgi:hypothetical protein
MLPSLAQNAALLPNEAFFTAVSALTVTGLSVIVPGFRLVFLGNWFY